MRFPLITAVLASTFLAVPVVGQHESIVIPAKYADVEAEASVGWIASPFDARYQLLIDARHLARHKGKQIRAISFRRNTGLNDELASGRLWIEAWASNSQASTVRPSPVFATNGGPDRVCVVQRYVHFPKGPSSRNVPAPWRPPYSVTLNLTKPFTYNGGTLALEITTRLRQPRSKETASPPWWALDGHAEDPAGTALTYGTSCIRAMPDQPAGADPGSLVVGGSALFYLHGGYRGATAEPVILTIGAQRMSLDLGRFGAAGCALYTDWLLLLTARLDPMPAGRHSQAQAVLPIPAETRLVGTSLSAQWLAIDLGQNGLGVTLSNGVRATLGRPSDDGFAWIESANPDSGVGRVHFGRYPVLRITFEKE